MQKYSLLRPLPGSKTLKNNKEPTSSSGPISNEFATAAFRMGHSLVQDQIYSWNQDNEINHFPLRYMFHMPTRLGTDNMIRGLVKVRSQKIDNQIVDALRLHLFQYNFLNMNLIFVLHFLYFLSDYTECVETKKVKEGEGFQIDPQLEPYYWTL